MLLHIIIFDLNPVSSRKLWVGFHDLFFFPCDKGHLAAVFPHPHSPPHTVCCRVPHQLTLERVKKPLCLAFYVKFVVLISGYFSPLPAAVSLCVSRAARAPRPCTASLASLPSWAAPQWERALDCGEAMTGCGKAPWEAPKRSPLKENFKGSHAKLQGPFSVSSRA